MERNYKLYVHISPSNKRYYGITKQEPKKRWKNGYGYKTNKYFTRAIEKYGWDNFKHEILFEDLTEEEAKLMEQMYIALYDTTNPKYGYNQTLGGDGTLGHEVTEEQRMKQSKIMKGRLSPNKDKKMSKESRDKISQSLKGREAWNKGLTGINTGKNHGKSKKVICLNTSEVFESISEAEKKYNSSVGRAVRNEINYAGELEDGTKLAWMYYKDFLLVDEDFIEEKINKAILSQKGENHPMYGKRGKNHPNSKPVRNIETGEIFPSCNEAGEKYNVKPNSIQSSISRKGRCGGYHWEYIKEAS